MSHLVPTSYKKSNGECLVRWHLLDSLPGSFNPFFDLALFKQLQTLPPLKNWVGTLDDLVNWAPENEGVHKIIFHPARCGSTLICRGLEAIGGYGVLSEPSIMGSLYQAYVSGQIKNITPYLTGAMKILAALFPGRQIVWKTHRPELIHCQELFRDAFPNAQFLYMTRSPVEVARSMMRSYPPFMHQTKDLEMSRRLEHIFQMLAPVYESILTAYHSNPKTVIRYEDIIREQKEKVLEWLGADPSPQNIHQFKLTQKWDSRTSLEFTPKQLLPEIENLIEAHEGLADMEKNYQETHR